MASQAGFIGRIGNVVHYKMGDKYYSRSMPVKYKQTVETRAKASQFGKASTTGKIIRKELSSVIFNRADKKMQIQLVKELVFWFELVRKQTTLEEQATKRSYWVPFFNRNCLTDEPMESSNPNNNTQSRCSSNKNPGFCSG